MRVSAKKTNGPSIEVDFDFGSNLSDVVAQYGEPVAFRSVVQNLKTQLQVWLRAQAVAGRTSEDVQAELNNNGWKPGERRVAKTPQDKLRTLFDQMTAEERAAFIKDFKAKAA